MLQYAPFSAVLWKHIYNDITDMEYTKTQLVIITHAALI